MAWSYSFFIICAVTANEDEYVEEWVKYHKHLGFNRIHIMDRNVNQSTKLAQISMDNFETVRVQHYPNEKKALGAYFKCAKPYSSYNVWAAFIDIDEFIVMRRHKNIKDMLMDLVPMGGALSLNRITFGSSGRRIGSPEPVLQRFTARAKRIDQHVKTISYLPHTLRVTPYFAVLREPHERVDPDGHAQGKTSSLNRHPTESTAVIHHYHVKSVEEFRRKELLNRGDEYVEAAMKGVGAPLEVESEILKEFRKLDENANVMQDTSAWVVYQQVQA